MRIETKITNKIYNKKSVNEMLRTKQKNRKQDLTQSYLHRIGHVVISIVVIKLGEKVLTQLTVSVKEKRGERQT